MSVPDPLKVTDRPAARVWAKSHGPAVVCSIPTQQRPPVAWKASVYSLEGTVKVTGDTEVGRRLVGNFVVVVEVVLVRPPPEWCAVVPVTDAAPCPPRLLGVPPLPLK
jgi:hypothetical protein